MRLENIDLGKIWMTAQPGTPVANRQVLAAPDHIAFTTATTVTTFAAAAAAALPPTTNTNTTTATVVIILITCCCLSPSPSLTAADSSNLHTQTNTTVS